MLKDSQTTRARGFSLVELLVVIAIIAIVMAIIVPALGGARVAAKRTATAEFMNNVSNAAMQFSQDHAGVMPGYFTPGDMGTAANDDESRGGFTMMENVLLDLIGQDAIVGKAGLQGGPADGKLVGPYGNSGNAGKGGNANIRVDLDLLGKGDGVYLHSLQDNLQAAEGQAASTPHQEFPDLVDAFGNPLLAWVEDPTAPREPEDLDDFAKANSKGDRARYYFASNSGWLTSKGLGKGGKDQTDPERGSLIAVSSEAPTTLSAVLGNPDWPTPTDYTPSTVRPASARGAFVVHSAGPDGVYFGRKDNGSKVLGGELEYKHNFFVAGSSNRLQDSNGKYYSIDLTKEFDDLLSASGN